MRIRRCAVLYIEAREEMDLDLASLLSGGSALKGVMRWVALAPHLDRETPIDAGQLDALGGIGQSAWLARDECEQRYGAGPIAALLEAGLLIGDAPEFAAQRGRDDTLRSQHWRPMSAAFHMFGRWHDMRTDTGVVQFPTFQDLVEAYGPPPATTVERAPEKEAVALPAPQRAPLDDTLFKRYTGRNFDPQAVLPLAVLSRLLQRAFGAQMQQEMAPGAFVFKKLSPSAGGMHPTEAYLLVQRVEGVACGLYHYHPVRHVLEPLGALEPAEAAALARHAVADQDWFVDAPVLVVLAGRVERNFWKYRNHAKAYRALMLDAGHLSQTFYLLATEAGLPAFITAAINEAPLERAFGLDPLCHAVVAVCGCGEAAAQKVTIELRYDAQSDLPG